MLRVLDFQPSSALENMQRDFTLLSTLEDIPILHLYEWEGKCASYGYFIDPSLYLNLENVKAQSLSIARRPTGGGITFHIWDYAFSLLVPSKNKYFSQDPLINYQFVNQVVLDVVKEVFSLDQVQMIPDSALSSGVNCEHFCMSRPTKYDVVYKGVKVAGAAQRKTRLGFLHQATISLAFPDINFLQEVLISNEDVLQAMQNFSFAPLGQIYTAQDLQLLRLQIKDRLKNEFECLFS